MQDVLKTLSPDEINDVAELTPAQIAQDAQTALTDDASEPALAIDRAADLDRLIKDTDENAAYTTAQRAPQADMSEILLNIHVEPLAEGGYLATSSDLNGLIAQGRTVAETLEIAQDVARRLIESYLEHGDPLPPKIQASLKQPSRRKTNTTIAVGVEV
jgi:antitoxin HicB